ncbi:hypothetical protein PhCBS80983_g01300 [Powellomyces hirtus]|uniref:THUMP domain-containing protein n=1 Tax=Powellomyces hirtus TaxID=109895 RepID=A0A507ECZ0_9FUNG|nr:hypothetical protein PhCBS80983_g01300 [Powellomyces hirtus]
MDPPRMSVEPSTTTPPAPPSGMKRRRPESGTPAASLPGEPTTTPHQPKKQKPTIPISRGKFKNRFLRKHSTLLHNTKSKGLERPRGIVVTCPVGAETRALGQIRTFLDRYLPTLFPDHKTVWISNPSALDVDLKIVGEEQDNIEEDDELEGDEKKDGKTAEPDRRFQAVDAACAGLLFVRFRVDTDPVEFAVRLFEYLESCPVDERAKIRSSISHCSRILPITHTMPANLPDIKSHLQTFLPDLLSPYTTPTPTTTSSSPPPPPTLPTLACITEVRNNMNLRTAAVRDAVLECVPNKDEWKVDLADPDVVLFTTVMKSVAGFACLPTYYRFRKYNVQLVGDPSAAATNDGKMAGKV